MSCARGCCETQREHYLSVGISAAAMPSRNGPRSAYATQRKEDEWSKDMDAYKRLRRDRLQPPRIDGAAEIEAKADDRVEVEHATILTKNQKAQLQAVNDAG